MKEDQVIVVDIHLTRGLLALLALALLAAAFLGYLAWNRDEAAAAGLQAPAASSPASPAGMRHFYLTELSAYVGGWASVACGDGYHMASLWEMVDPSNLKYAWPSWAADSGQGPPSGWQGWVRTGAGSSNIQAPGIGNCNAWTSSSAGDYGTVAQLAQDWLGTGAHSPNFQLWHVDVLSCDNVISVWCVED